MNEQECVNCARLKKQMATIAGMFVTVILIMSATIATAYTSDARYELANLKSETQVMREEINKIEKLNSSIIISDPTGLMESFSWRGDILPSQDENPSLHYFGNSVEYLSPSGEWQKFNIIKGETAHLISNNGLISYFTCITGTNACHTDINNTQLTAQN